MPLKILQVISCFYPAWAYGGPVKVAYDVSRKLVERGHEVTVYTSDMSNDGCLRTGSRTKEVAGIQVHYFKNISAMISKEMKQFITPEMITAAKREIRGFDVAHLHEYRTFQNIIVHHYARKYSIPYVLQAHGSLPRTQAKQELKWIYDMFFGNKLLKDASKMIAINQMEAKQYRSMGVSEEKIAIIPNGIDLSEYTDLPPKGSFKLKFNIEEDEKIILYLGRIHRIKGLDILVKAFANIVKKLDDVKLVVVGPDDGYLRELQDLIKALRIEDSVLISGPLYGRDKLRAYVDADVYVLPSRYEIWGMTIAEAVACGTPVILTENCGVADYCRDKTGIVVEPYSDRLFKALLEMLLDEDRQRALRKNCKAVAKEFSIPKVVSKLQEIYEEITNGSK